MQWYPLPQPLAYFGRGVLLLVGYAGATLPGVNAQCYELDLVYL